MFRSHVWAGWQRTRLTEMRGQVTWPQVPRASLASPPPGAVAALRRASWEKLGLPGKEQVGGREKQGPSGGTFLFSKRRFLLSA